eukprot:scaffold8638_cov77-Cylindrotheca_fusiformis.AAC.1
MDCFGRCLLCSSKGGPSPPRLSPSGVFFGAIVVNKANSQGYLCLRKVFLGHLKQRYSTDAVRYRRSFAASVLYDDKDSHFNC